ncbi:hypothetical protein K457DRAFT_1869968 [Linnemannia elongata AG-77]|uniref:Uncharacterized protein n=1 Tax=Linnemannia elongata AG-77 TaxID=1314771 RepID=A0A197KE76_9FUNG|nr:hypothetical protein K457DRAFT_1869968 [Linnemannia elongata AG-77]
MLRHQHPQRAQRNLRQQESGYMSKGKGRISNRIMYRNGFFGMTYYYGSQKHKRLQSTSSAIIFPTPSNGTAWILRNRYFSKQLPSIYNKRGTAMIWRSKIYFSRMANQLVKAKHHRTRLALYKTSTHYVREDPQNLRELRNCVQDIRKGLPSNFLHGL